MKIEIRIILAALEVCLSYAGPLGGSIQDEEGEAMRGGWRSGLGAVLAAGMILGGIAPAFGDMHEAAPAATDGTDSGDGVAPSPAHTSSAEPSTQAAAKAASPEQKVVSPTANAADWAPPDPARYPRLDVPTKPWAYDTAYFFQLTRGLEDEVESTWGRRASMLGTVPIDVVGLPTAAIAGLFGS